MIKNVFTLVLMLVALPVFADPFEECASRDSHAFFKSIGGPFSQEDIESLEIVVLTGCIEALKLQNSPDFDRAAAADKVKEIVRKALKDSGQTIKGESNI